MTKIPEMYPDFWCERDAKLKCFVEVKCRTGPSTQYETYFIDLYKVRTGIQWSAYMSVPFFLIVEWTDRAAYIEVTHPRVEDCRIGGRTDRNDPNDIEPVVHTDIKEFRHLWKTNNADIHIQDGDSSARTLFPNGEGTREGTDSG